jgi:hypothetical protein
MEDAQSIICFFDSGLFLSIEKRFIFYNHISKKKWKPGYQSPCIPSPTNNTGKAKYKIMFLTRLANVSVFGHHFEIAVKYS